MALLPTTLAGFLEIQPRICEHLGLSFFPLLPLLCGRFVLSLSLRFTILSPIFFVFFLSPPSTHSLLCIFQSLRTLFPSLGLFRSFCLRISVFYNSLFLTHCVHPSFCRRPLQLNHLLYYGAGPFFFLFLLLHVHIPLPNLRKVHFACHSYRLREQRSEKTARKHPYRRTNIEPRSSRGILDDPCLPSGRSDHVEIRENVGCVYNSCQFRLQSKHDGMR